MPARDCWLEHGIQSRPPALEDRLPQVVGGDRHFCGLVLGQVTGGLMGPIAHCRRNGRLSRSITAVTMPAFWYSDRAMTAPAGSTIRLRCMASLEGWVHSAR